MASHLKLTQRRSVAGRPWQQRLVLKGLGLRGIGSEALVPNLRPMRGMVRKVLHLVDVAEVDGPAQEATS